jgi:hypothetical protein
MARRIRPKTLRIVLIAGPLTFALCIGGGFVIAQDRERAKKPRLAEADLEVLHRTLVDDPRAAVRLEVAEILGERGESESSAVLNHALNFEQDSEVREAISHAFIAIGKAGWPDGADADPRSNDLAEMMRQVMLKRAPQPALDATGLESNDPATRGGPEEAGRPAARRREGAGATPGDRCDPRPARDPE